MPQPALPAMLTIPSTKSTSPRGIGSGSQRNWFGGAGTSSKPPVLSLSQRAPAAAVRTAGASPPDECGTATSAGSHAAAR